MKRDYRKTAFDTPEFAKLQAEWYARLKADGFDDIEEAREEAAFDVDSPFRDFDYQREERRSLDLSGAAEYYTIAQQWMDRARWTTRRERIFFSAWAYGAEIKELHRTHPIDYGCSYSRMVDIFRQLRKEMIETVSLEDGLGNDEVDAMIASYEQADPELSNDPKDLVS